MKKKDYIETIEVDSTLDHFFKATPINLDIAGIFFCGANDHLAKGTKHFIELEKSITDYNKVLKKNKKKYGDTSCDDFITTMSPKFREMEPVFEPVLRHLCTFKILLVCSIEAFINDVGLIKLKGKIFEEFDKLSILGKWLFIHDLLKLENNYSLGEEPIQGIAKLIKDRNKIVHYKGKPQKTTFDIPDFISLYNLHPEECKKNIYSVRLLISQLTQNWTGSTGPHWLKDKNYEYFRTPCFYLNSREASLVLYSSKVDKDKNSD